MGWRSRSRAHLTPCPGGPADPIPSLFHTSIAGIRIGGKSSEAWCYVAVQLHLSLLATLARSRHSLVNSLQCVSEEVVALIE